MEQDRYDLAVVALHPIQYQAGLWRTIARHPRLRLRVLYLDRVGIDGSIDPTMKAAMKWNMPLLEGHEYEFLRNLSPFRFTPVVHRLNPGIYGRIRRGGYGVVILHGYLTLSNWIALLAARRAGCFVVYRGEGSVRGGDRYDAAALGPLKRGLSRLFLRYCDAIAYSSQDNRRYQLSRGAREDRLFSMPCAVDNEERGHMQKAAAPSAEFRARHGLPSDARLVITVGRFAEHKRMEDCIAAFGEAPLRDRDDVHLLLVGDGRLRTDLEQQAQNSSASGRIHFLGFLNQQEMVEAVLASDVFALASSHGDPSPKALAEALFLARPIVCSDGVGTCEEAVVDGENGFVFPTADPGALARCIVQVIADENDRRQMGERSRSLARTNDFATGVDSLVRQVDSLHAARRRGSGVPS
ncbi:MAG: glycosyltransferase [Myxococcota bacterium]|nr:glycosyltransferase [Myxococcota bacterium]